MVYLHWCRKLWNQYCIISLLESVHEFVLNEFMCEESVPSLPVTILLGHSGFGYCFGRVDDAVSNNIHEVISLVSGLMCNDTNVCCGSMYLKIVVWYLSDRWKSLESESAMMFYFTLMCWDYRDTSLLMMVHPIHWKTTSWGYSSTGSNDALCIHPRELELSVNDRMWDPCTSCWMVM